MLGIIVIEFMISPYTTFGRNIIKVTYKFYQFNSNLFEYNIIMTKKKCNIKITKKKSFVLYKNGI